MVAADRCYFCYDAPCITACPTDIDIPLFIRQISTGTAESAAKTIFEQNILGGMCARVCPTETLCEEACVREVAEGKPVEIGKLQRFATDLLMDQDQHPFEREPETGKKICVVGAGRWGKNHIRTLYEMGCLSAIVEPIFAVIGAAIVMMVYPILPYALAFSAGAMIFIVVEEVIPESQRGGNTDLATMGLITGFIVMMILDVALG